MNNLPSVPFTVYTRNGIRVTILSTSRHHEVYKLVGLIHEHTEDKIGSWTVEGKFFFNTQTNFDLILPEKFKKDDPVMVSLDGYKWERRYFYKITDGSHPFVTFNGGLTSWSTRDDYHSNNWKFCRKPTEAELSTKE